MLHRSFKPAKCKTALNLAKSRIKLMKNKKENQLRQLKREVAQLLESAQDQTARIRVEHVIREEKLIAAYELIDIYCELIVMRLPIIESQKNCPLDLKEAITSLIFAAPRCGDITELQDVRKQFTAKYGKEFATAAAELRPACGVSRTLVEKLSVNAPDGQTKVKVLTAIAEEHNIQWEPNWFKDENPVPSVEIPKVEVEHSVEDSKIQMQHLNFEIADDLEETHVHDIATPGTSTQSHAHTNSNLVPPSSTSRPDFRPSESSAAKMTLNQLSGTAESAFVGGRQKWNMEFKDAAAAAQAAAESAEMASLAARAAAELSIRSNMTNEDNRHNAGIGLQQNHVHGNSTSNGSFNQRSPRLQNQGDANRQGNMTEGGDATSSNQDYSRRGRKYETGKQDFMEIQNSRMHTRDSDSTSGSYNQRSPRLPNQRDASRQGIMTVEDEVTSSNKDYTRYEGQYETGKHDFTERENHRMYTRDSDSLKTEPNMLNSSNFQENEIGSSENPFHEETEERKNQSSSFQSQSNAFGDEYGVFANLNYDKDKSGPGDGSFGRFSRNTADQEDWHVRSAYTSGEEGMTSKDYREGKRILESDIKYGFDSGNDIFIGMNHRTSGANMDEKGNNTNAGVVFDESGSDEDDKSFLNSDEVHDFSSPAETTRLGSTLSQTSRYFDPDLSESFKRSPIYSKLTEPLPVAFDDSDGENSGSENEFQKQKRNPGVFSYDYEKPDADNLELRSSNVEKGTTDFFMSSKQLEENQNRFSGSISKNKYSSSELSSKTSSAAVSTGFKGLYDNDIFDESGPQTSLQSLRFSESPHPVSEFISETKPTPVGGMELNLGSLPGGRRNRAHGRTRDGLADALSPARSSEASPGNTFGSTEKASTNEFHVPSSPIDNKQAPMKRSGHYAHDSPDDDTEEVLVRKNSESTKGRHSMTTRIDGYVHKSSPKDRTIYSDDSSSEEDVPKPVSSKTFRSAGLSRRTKASSPTSVVSSHTTNAAKTGRSSSSYNTEVSSSRNTDLSSLDDGRKFVTKPSKDDISSSSSVPEKPATPERPTVPEASKSNEQAHSRENSIKNPSHVHPKLPDFETFTAHLQSLRKNRQ